MGLRTVVEVRRRAHLPFIRRLHVRGGVGIHENGSRPYNAPSSSHRPGTSLNVGAGKEAGLRPRSIRHPGGDLLVATALAAFLLPAGLVSASHAASFQSAAGKTYIVNSTADRPDADVGNGICRDAAGKCTLRAAIMQANFHAGADTISLPAGTFKLTRHGNDDMAVLGDLDITDSVTIEGAGSGLTIVDGNGSVTLDRVFQVFPSASDTTFRGLAIRNGKKNIGTFDEGGGLYWEGGGGRLSLSNVVVEDNHASYGGGITLIFSSSGDTVDLNRLTIRGNKAKAAAGGALVELGTGAQFTLRNSHIHANAASEGGGLYLQGDPGPFAPSPLIRNTEIDANTAGLSAGFENQSGTVALPVVLADDFLHGNAAGFDGGAIGSYGVLDVTASTLAGNTSGSRGAGLFVYAGGTSNLVNATIARNVSKGYGGAVYMEVFQSFYSTVSMTNVTVRGNAALAFAGGGGIYATGGVVTLTNTLFAKGSSGANCSVTFGGTSSLSDDISCGFGAGDGIADLMLGRLSHHGGLTETIVPRAGSPAVDAGASGGAPIIDQRGIVRPQGAAVDVGAVEVCPGKPAAPVLVSPANTTLHVRRVVLDWTDVSCIQGYTVVVRRGSSTGPTVQEGTGLAASTFTTRPLERDGTYYWRVTAIGDRGKTASVWRHFRLE
jgi:CSLREA domain-containing protein